MTALIRTSDRAPTQALTLIDSALGTIGQIKSSVQDAYDKRVEANTNDVQKWILAHPAFTKYGPIGAFAGGVVAALGCAALSASLGALGGEVIPFMVSVAAALVLPGVIESQKNLRARKEQRQSALTPRELSGLEQQLMRMTVAERTAVRNYIQEWGLLYGNTGCLNPETKSNLVSLVDHLPPDPAMERIGEAAAIIGAAPVQKDFFVFQRRITDLLERTPQATRYELAQALKSHLFAGGRYVYGNFTAAQQHQLYERINEFAAEHVPIGFACA